MSKLEGTFEAVKVLLDQAHALISCAADLAEDSRVNPKDQWGVELGKLQSLVDDLNSGGGWSSSTCR